MEILIPIFGVLLVITAAIVLLVMRSTDKGGTRRGEDPSAGAGADNSMPGIGADHTPLADTSEHAGEQTSDGRTVSGQDAATHGGTGGPPRSYAGSGPLGEASGHPQAGGRPERHDDADVRREGEAEGLSEAVPLPPQETLTDRH